MCGIFVISSQRYMIVQAKANENKIFFDKSNGFAFFKLSRKYIKTIFASRKQQNRVQALIIYIKEK